VYALFLIYYNYKIYFVLNKTISITIFHHKTTVVRMMLKNLHKLIEPIKLSTAINKPKILEKQYYNILLITLDSYFMHYYLIQSNKFHITYHKFSRFEIELCNNSILNRKVNNYDIN
jgi:hypothetical protein